MKPETKAREAGSTNASATALSVAAQRAAHLLLDDPPPILADTVAIRLLGPGADDSILERAETFRTASSLALRSHVLLRSRQAEDRLELAAGRGIGQYVIVGAGFDTFAYRQPAWASSLRLFEVDHPASQTAKLERLASASVASPPNLSFVAADLDVDPLADRLAGAGFDLAARSFVSCLGVSMYLAPETVDAILRFAASLAAGSELVMTFARPPVPGFDGLAERAASVGEAWRTRFEPADLERRMRELGFSDVELLRPEEAQERYFGGRRDGLRAPHRANTVVATV